jgi:hypothetical protein
MRDTLQREMPRPTIEEDASFVESSVSTDLPMPVAEYGRVSRQIKLEEVLVGSKNIPRVIRTEPLTESWGPVKSRRRVVLADGSTALEELVEDRGVALYQYEVWNFTSANGKYIAYAVGQFECTGDENSTHVVWTYRFRPTSWLASLFVKPFVHGEYHEFMLNGMEAIRKAVLERWKSEGRAS